MRAELLARLERDLEPETVDRDGVRLPRAETDVHPLVLRIPVRVVPRPAVDRMIGQDQRDRAPLLAIGFGGHSSVRRIGG